MLLARCELKDTFDWYLVRKCSGVRKASESFSMY